jgi:amino acid permease
MVAPMYNPMTNNPPAFNDFLLLSLSLLLLLLLLTGVSGLLVVPRER